MEEKCNDHEQRVVLLEKIAERHEATLKDHEANMNKTLIEISDKPKKAYDKYKDTIVTIVITAIVTGLITKIVKGW